MVSGTSGFIGSHVVDQLLRLGYRVRGTVRSAAKADWVKAHFEKEYPGQIELIEVPDMGADGAFDEAVKGCSGFIHVATPVMQNHDPNFGIPVVVNGALNMLNAAKTEPMLKRGVLTSSSTAAADPNPNVEFTIDENTWNTAILEKAWAPPPYEGVARMLAVYSASKLSAEQASWNWMKENNPQFSLNAVLPNANMGLVLDTEHQGAPSTVGWLKALWNGFEGKDADLAKNPAQYYINVQDNALVHVAALLSPDVNSERLFTFAKPFNWNDILAIYRKNWPNHKFIDDLPDLGQDLSHVANQRAEELLKRFGQEKGWKSLEESVKDAVFWA